MKDLKVLGKDVQKLETKHEAMSKIKIRHKQINEEPPQMHLVGHYVTPNRKKQDPDEINFNKMGLSNIKYEKTFK